MGVIDLDRFVADGFAKVEAVVPRQVGDAARALLWKRIGLSPDDPSGWTQPVVWTADLTGEGPFGQIMASPRLHAALDAVAGPGGWVPRGSVGNIPVRFPRMAPADDRGWHIDLNTELPDGTWGVSGRPGTLLLLVLFSDVGPDDAPTRVRAGSQRDMAKVLDERVIDPMRNGPLFDETGRDRPVALATGQPGDAYLLHPFTVHAAQEHRGTEPRFMAQLPIPLVKPLAPGDDTPLARAAGW
ncbi:phytanoyl-CoA dioxygenase family protein [Thermoactinospora rubra]|uniref:phytanoyl-CoA dioxygenase family protein n=1 Tax=Thermoactinospora rubra TaxID=1088767 RepID=UPI000A10328D|nr:phytanoyl-CoA dioxygenase family protein [Thermoactinospora rubra]